MSDLVRLLLLSKKGGAYLDTDVLSLKPLPEMKNFIIEGTIQLLCTNTHYSVTYSLQVSTFSTMISISQCFQLLSPFLNILNYCLH